MRWKSIVVQSLRGDRLVLLQNHIGLAVASCLIIRHGWRWAVIYGVAPWEGGISKKADSGDLGDGAILLLLI